MSVADELAAFVTPNGPACRLAVLSRDHPTLYADLMEAIFPPEGDAVQAGTAVARWWNERRRESGLILNHQTVNHHRAKECKSCR